MVNNAHGTRSHTCHSLPRWAPALLLAGLLLALVAGVAAASGPAKLSDADLTGTPDGTGTAAPASPVLTTTLTWTPTLPPTDTPSPTPSGTATPTPTDTDTPAPTDTDTPAPTATTTATPTVAALPPVAVQTPGTGTAQSPAPPGWLWPVIGAAAALMVAAAVAGGALLLRRRRLAARAADVPVAEPKLTVPLLTETAEKPAVTLPLPTLPLKPPAGRPYLQSTQKPELWLLLDKGMLRAGRAADNDLVIDSRFPESETVSQHHARLEWDRRRQRWIVIDEQSRNGVFVQDQRTGENVLNVTDRVRFGQAEFMLRVDADAQGGESNG